MVTWGTFKFHVFCYSFFFFKGSYPWKKVKPWHPKTEEKVVVTGWPCVLKGKCKKRWVAPALFRGSICRLLQIPVETRIKVERCGSQSGSSADQWYWSPIE
jgi:hypothetical protein